MVAGLLYTPLFGGGNAQGAKGGGGGKGIES